MNNDRELIHSALLWSAAHARRLVVGTEKRRLAKAIKAGEDTGFHSPLRRQEAEAGRQVTELKRKELAALRVLANACAKQRGRLDMADVIDVDGVMVLLPAADLLDLA